MTVLSTKVLLFGILACLCTVRCRARGRDESGPLQFVEDKYHGLSNKGKFIATAAVGFVGTRIAMKTAMSALKIGAAAFITAEILHHTGITEDIPSLSNEQQDMLKGVKQQVFKRTNAFRMQVRHHLNRDAIKDMFEKEKIGGLGLASGALVGTLL